MTEQPYTNDDLRAEAARQHYSLTDDADYGCVGESMADEGIGDTSEIWGALPHPDYEAAQSAIHDLIIHAADISEWAVDLGADHLEPAHHSITFGDSDEKPFVRLHIAYGPDVPQSARDGFALELARVVRDRF